MAPYQIQNADGKSILASKTLWVNVLTILITIVTALSGADFIPAEYMVWITALVLPILNVILRFFTNEPVSVEATMKNRRHIR